MTVLLLLASLAWSQSTTTLQVPLEDQLKLQNVRKDVREILVGRPTVTGLPTFQNGIKFGDGTIQVSSPAAPGASVLRASETFISGSVGITGTSFGVAYATACLSVAVGSATVYATVPGLGNGGINVFGNILINGQYVNGISSTDPGMNFTFCNGTNYCGFTIHQNVNAASAETMCAGLQIKVSAGTFDTSASGGTVPRVMVGISQ